MSKSHLLDTFDYRPGDEVTYTSNQGTALATVEAVATNGRYLIEYTPATERKAKRKMVDGYALAPYFSEKAPRDAS